MKKKRFTFFLLILPTIITVSAVIVLMNWHIPTSVQGEIMVSRAVFTVGGTEEIKLFNSFLFKSITVQNFSQIKLNPAKLEVADPSEYNENMDVFPESAWKFVEFDRQFIKSNGKSIESDRKSTESNRQFIE